MRRLRTGRASSRSRIRRDGARRARAWARLAACAAPTPGMALRVGRVGLGVWATLALAVALCASAVTPAFGLTSAREAPRAQAAPLDSGSISILVPANPQGPVGTNLYIRAAGLTPGDAYQLGYAPQSATCAGTVTPISTASPATAESNGAFFSAFAWPPDANAVGTAYYICAQDQTTPTNPPVASADLFTVDSAAAPSIQINAVDRSGAPLATPPPNNTLYAGGYAQITGNNFLPGGVQLLVQETADPFTASLYNPNRALSVVSGSPITTASGSFTIVVQLPQEQGAFYLSVVSADGRIGPPAVLSSLVASQQVTISPPPATPTPTVSATATATATPTPTPSPSRGPSSGQVAAVVGLGSASVLFFLIGIILLVSAAVTSRPRL